jgi:hypothetical protein
MIEHGEDGNDSGDSDKKPVKTGGLAVFEESGKFTQK